MKKHREISGFDKLLIYFKAGPFILGEFFCLGGIIGAVIFLITFQIEALISIIFLGIGLFFLRRKFKILFQGINAIEFGDKGIATVNKISNTNFQHNDRVVKEYDFKFLINNDSYFYSHKSANHNELKIGDQLAIFYLPDKPYIAIIPELFSVNVP